MAKRHRHATTNPVIQQALAMKPELDLFTNRPLQISIESSVWNDLKPISNVRENNPISFVISGNEDDFLDPVMHVAVRVRVISNTGTDLPLDSSVALVNLFGHALFERVDMKLQDKLIAIEDYPYRAYLERLLSYGAAAKNTQLTAEGFYKDAAGKFDTLDTTMNDGYAMRKQLCSQSRLVCMFVRLSTDLANQPRLLPNLVDVSLTLHQKNNPFRLMFPAGEAPRVVIDDISLHYRTVKLASSMASAIAETMRLQPLRYPVSHVVVKTFQIAANTTALDRESLSRGQLPKAVLVGVVETDAYIGTGSKSPFNFQHKSANQVCLYRESEMIPSIPFTPNFKVGDCMREYLSLFQITGYLGDDRGNYISYLDYSDEGYILYGFDLTPDECGSSCHAATTKSGNLSLKMNFDVGGVDQSCMVVVYMVYDNNIYIDNNRNVLLDFA